MGTDLSRPELDENFLCFSAASLELFPTPATFLAGDGAAVEAATRLKPLERRHLKYCCCLVLEGARK